jgi:hypothetical protein
MSRDDRAYACVRIVRAAAGAPSAPALAVPAGWATVDEPDHAVASPGEFYAFLSGPTGAVGELGIDWPGVAVAAVVSDGSRLPCTGRGGSLRCRLRLAAASARAAWPTLEVHSHLDEPDLPIRIEHNHEARRAGWFLAQPWVGGEARAAVNWILAARTMLRDWGIHRRLLAAGIARLQLMGFESNNPLHLDHPPHWHLMAYLPRADGAIDYDAPGSQVPHFYLDGLGRIVANSEHVVAMPHRGRRLGPGEPMGFISRDGKPLFALTIRADGGLDVADEAGLPRYALVGAGPGGDAREGVAVLAQGRPLAVVAWRYDPLIGRAVRA